jgi:hypothetical protein
MKWSPPWRSLAGGKRVVRLHTGDPSLYGAIFEQMAKFSERGIPYTVIPGVTAAFAAAAALGVEYTLPEVSQTLILTRMAGRTPVPDTESLASLAAHRATMAIYLSISMLDEMTRILSKPTAPTVPVRWCPGQPARAANSLDHNGTTCRNRQAGENHPDSPRRRRPRAGREPGCSGSPLQTLRPALCPRIPGCGGPPVMSAGHGRTAIWALTPNGAALARIIADGMTGSTVFLSDKLAAGIDDAFRFNRLKEEVDRQFAGFPRHIFIMATGIVVRSIAGHLVHKTTDPAVVVCDEAGQFAISLVSGHVGGANALAPEGGHRYGGQPVITTATDVNRVPAIDVIAVQAGLAIENPEAIKAVNMALLTGSPIAVHDPYGRVLPGNCPRPADRRLR